MYLFVLQQTANAEGTSTTHGVETTPTIPFSTFVSKWKGSFAPMLAKTPDFNDNTSIGL